MPFLKYECPMCKKIIKVNYNQTISRGEVLFFMQYNCECGFSSDEDSTIIPEKFRDEIIQESGLWQLKCYDKIKCLKFLRQKYLYSMEKIKELKKVELITFEGTATEMKALGNKMEKEGIKLIIERIE
ncbi:hypothetical protein [Tepidibacter hydrothermalis]|uniref:Zinc finger Ogr/Delta-type domain-containing protein n=1 Tax=Tepidibacter hydrothermalis TaxID=3036126 RepID=A0ABY8E7U3_9FIRM|nr:hypothetical protein [Tepidibacter hydrothermalis]WFD08957.1 hypothetical protein P4S50_11215 [Tepidibacter hydrothermalis]